MAGTAEVLLAGADREARCMLGLATRIEYVHPAMSSAIAGGSQLPAGPWLQRLEDGWVRVRPCWRQPLRAVLGERAIPGRDALHQSADWLLEAGACEQAVVLYLEIGDHDCAARAIASWASVLMDLGQWATLQHNMATFSLGLRSPHPYASPAWKWILMWRPVAYYFSCPRKVQSDCITAQAISGMGNPFVFWGSVIALPYVLFAWRRARDWRGGFIIVALLGQYLPWFVQTRPTFFFYVDPLQL